MKGKAGCERFYSDTWVDFFETYASVVRYESLWMNLAIATALDMEAWQVDYVAVYLNSHPQVITYIELPDGAKVKGKIGQLNKMLYGTMDGAYNWAETLNKEWESWGITGLKQILRSSQDM